MRDYQITPLRNVCRQHPQYQTIKAATSIKQLSPQVVNQIVTVFVPLLVRQSDVTDQKNKVYARARFRNAILRQQL